MNWRRGLLRLWVVTALCWLVVVACLASYESLLVPWLTAREQRACFDEHTSHPALGNPFDCFDKKAAIQPPPTATYAFVGIAPILGSLLLGFEGLDAGRLQAQLRSAMSSTGTPVAIHNARISLLATPLDGCLYAYFGLIE